MPEIKFYCPRCSEELTVDAISADDEVKCPICSSTMRVPTKSAPMNVAIKDQQTELRVVVQDFDMKFSSMVAFLVKLTLAAIPALVILGLLAAGVILLVEFITAAMQ
jgi:DNA-directed RNA polymerase subunit RPC12/RpoP